VIRLRPARITGDNIDRERTVPFQRATFDTSLRRLAEPAAHTASARLPACRVKMNVEPSPCIEAGGEGMPVDLAELLESEEPFE